MRSNPALRLILLLVTGTLLLTACGGGGDESADASNQLATLETTAPDEQASGPDVTVAGDGSDSDSDDAATLTFEDAQLEFSQCMRDNGYPEWPDPDPAAAGGRGPGGFGVDLEALGIDRRDADFRETQQTCRSAFDGLAGGRQELDPEQQAELEDSLLSLFACVRQNEGFENIPDPDFTGGDGFGLRELFESGDFDPQELLPLMQECRESLGIEGFGPGGGRGGVPGGGRGGDATPGADA